MEIARRHDVRFYSDDAALLEGLTQRVPSEEIFTFTKLLLLAAFILPVLPRTAFTQFQIDSFKTWLIVVAVSTVSHGSYLVLVAYSIAGRGIEFGRDITI